MNYNNYFIKLEKNIESILNIYAKEIKIKTNSSFLNSYLKYLYVSLINSNKFLELHNNYYDNSIKKKYCFSEYELFFLAKIFCLKFNIKTIIEISKSKNIYNSFLSILKIIYWLITIGFGSLKKLKSKKKEYFFFKNIKDQSQIKYKSLLNINCLQIDKLFLFQNSNISVFKKIFSIKYNIFKYTKYFEINFKYLAYKESLNKLLPSKIFFIEGDTSDQELISEISKKNNTITYCFQWGSFILKNVKFGFKKMSHKYFFCWGENYLNDFKKYNKFTKFIVAGNPQLKKIKPKNKILILMHPPTSFITNQETVRLNNLIKMISNIYNDKVIIRYHPSTKSKLNLENVIEHDPKIIPLIKSLEESFCCVSIRSSAIIEAARLGVIPIILNNNIKILEKNLLILKDINSKSLFFNNNNSALKFIINIVENDSLKNKLSKTLIKKFNYVIKYVGNESISIIRKKFKSFAYKSSSNS